MVVRAGGRAWALTDLELPENGSYLVLESLTKEAHHAKTIHVLVPNSPQCVYTLGRSHGADLEIPDPTVSRVHAAIEFQSGCFVLKDNRSKYGTLVLLQGSQQIGPGCLLSVQTSNILLTFALSCSSAPGSPRAPGELSGVSNPPALYQ